LANLELLASPLATLLASLATLATLATLAALATLALVALVLVVTVGVLAVVVLATVVAVAVVAAGLLLDLALVHAANWRAEAERTADAVVLALNEITAGASGSQVVGQKAALEAVWDAEHWEGNGARGDAWRADGHGFWVLVEDAGEQRWEPVSVVSVANEAGVGRDVSVDGVLAALSLLGLVSIALAIAIAARRRERHGDEGECYDTNVQLHAE